MSKVSLVNGMFSTIGVLNVDHYAVTTKNLIGTLKDFLSIPNAKLVRGPGENNAQQVRYAFVELNGMGVVEILAPLNDESPIWTHLNSGSGAYHLCYSVKNLDSAITIAEKEFGARIVVEPKADGAFDGRRVAFLFHPNHGLFELLEAYPSFVEGISTEKTVNITRITSLIDTLLSLYKNVVTSNDEIKAFEDIDMDNSEEWDSFKHLLFIMEIEKHFEISIPASDMSKLNSLKKISQYLEDVL